MNYIEIFFFLMCGHAIADFALQSQFIADGKNRNTELGKIYWPYCLSAHGLIHGFFVAIFTGHFILGIFETIAHMAIDFGKCEKRYGMITDQALHVFCKVLWIVYLIGFNSAGA